MTQFMIGPIFTFAEYLLFLLVSYPINSKPSFPLFESSRKTLPALSRIH